MPAKQLHRLTDMLMENISVSKHKFEKSEDSVAYTCRYALNRRVDVLACAKHRRCAVTPHGRCTGPLMIEWGTRVLSGIESPFVFAGVPYAQVLRAHWRGSSRAPMPVLPRRGNPWLFCRAIDFRDVKISTRKAEIHFSLWQFNFCIEKYRWQLIVFQWKKIYLI